MCSVTSPYSFHSFTRKSGNSILLFNGFGEVFAFFFVWFVFVLKIAHAIVSLYPQFVPVPRPEFRYKHMIDSIFSGVLEMPWRLARYPCTQKTKLVFSEEQMIIKEILILLYSQSLYNNKFVFLFLFHCHDIKKRLQYRAVTHTVICLQKRDYMNTPITHCTQLCSCTNINLELYLQK